jgi:hypothetical protein
MIALPNPFTNMELTQDQYDQLLANYIEQTVDGMDMDSLIQFASDMLEQNLRETCSTPDELIEEISRFYDEDYVNEMVESVTNVDS